MLFLNIFPDDPPLLETVPQGEVSVPVELAAEVEAELVRLLKCDRRSAALAQLVLAGVKLKERKRRRVKR